MIWYIYSLLNRAATGSLTGTVTAIIVWTIVLIEKTGPSTTWQLIKEMGPIISEGKFTSKWLVNTGALPAAIIGLISAPYLGPIVGKYLWLILERTARTVPEIAPVIPGTICVGLIAGILGYLLRVA